MNQLIRSSPLQQGVDPRSLLALVEALDASPHEMHSLMVLRHGQVVSEGWWAPYRPEIPHLLYSLSKSFTSMAVGLAIDEGLFGLDDTLVSLLGAHGAEPVDERVAAITVRHALTMSTGHTADPLLEMFGWILENPGSDWLDGFFALRPGAEPGAPFTYNQFATYSLARIVEAKSGQRLIDYLRPRLLDPLGISDAMWLTDGRHDLGFSGLHARTEAIASLGQLLLQRGRWGDRQLIPEPWVMAATTQQVSNDAANRAPQDSQVEPDWTSGYGYQFWMCRHGYRGDGALGQFCVVWPDHDVVIATTATTLDMQDMLEIIERELAGAFNGHWEGTEGQEAEEALRLRLADLKLPTVIDHGDGFRPGTFTRRAGGAADSLQGVTLLVDGEGWSLELDHLGEPAVLPVGRGVWVDGTWPAKGPGPTQPVACSGGRAANGDFVVEIVFTQTPHRLQLVLRPEPTSPDYLGDPVAGVMEVAWNQFPLHGSDPAGFAPA